MPNVAFNLVWDQAGEKKFETGIDRGVLYPVDANGTYPNGVAWNGLTSVSDSPEGGDENTFYADNIKYGAIRGTEDFGGTIEAYTYPDEWEECDGSRSLVTGVSITQQIRKGFGLSYRSLIGNDVAGLEYGYKIHLVYGATASPAERSHETVNESPDAQTMSWDYTTVPVPVEGFKPTAHLIIDSTKVDSAKLTAFEQVIYGTPASGTGQDAVAAVPARLPLPDEVAQLLS